MPQSLLYLIQNIKLCRILVKWRGQTRDSDVRTGPSIIALYCLIYHCYESKQVQIMKRGISLYYICVRPRRYGLCSIGPNGWGRRKCFVSLQQFSISPFDSKSRMHHTQILQSRRHGPAVLLQRCDVGDRGGLSE